MFGSPAGKHGLVTPVLQYTKELETKQACPRWVGEPIFINFEEAEMRGKVWRWLSGLVAGVMVFLWPCGVWAATDPPADGGSWVTLCADCQRTFERMGHRYLVLDSSGQPHLVYGGDHLYHAWYEANKWRVETVDDAPGVGQAASAAVDGAGHLHIAYHDHVNGALRYAWYDGSRWQTQQVVQGNETGWINALALDGDGHPHILYVTYRDPVIYPQNYAYLMHAWNDGQGWQVEVVDEGMEVGVPLSAAVDANGTLQVAYSGPLYDDSVRYARRDGNGWSKEVVLGKGTTISSISLALDRAARPHIVYSLYDSAANISRLYHAWRDDAGQWHPEAVSGASLDVRYGAMAVDADDGLHIGYTTASSLYYAHYVAGTGWESTLVTSGSVPGAVSLAVDAEGLPRLGYYDGWDHTLRYAAYSGSYWRREEVDRVQEPGSGSSLALDAQGLPHVVYDDLRMGMLYYTHYDGQTWQQREIVSTGNSGRSTYASLALDGAQRPHVSYARSDGLWYATRDEAGRWTWSPVASVSAMHTSLALDGTGNPFIAYYNSGPTELQYAWREGETWQRMTVDAEQFTGAGASLVLDAQGHPHISYNNWGQYDLKYAWHDGTAWRVMLVDVEGGLCQTALALDAAGHPHIAYQAITAHDYRLKYAWHDGAAWQQETLVVSDAWIGDVAMGLDAEGDPHIVYVYALEINGESRLGYARREGGRWVITTLGPTVVYGDMPSLALDAQGFPHVTYYDVHTSDLRYTRLLPRLGLSLRVTPWNAATGSPVTYTLTLEGAGLTVQLHAPLPAGMRYITGSVTAPAVYSPTLNAVVWSGTMPADAGRLTLRYQARLEETNTMPIVATAWLTDTYGRSETSTAVLNGRHLFLPAVMRGQ